MNNILQTYKRILVIIPLLLLTGILLSSCTNQPNQTNNNDVSNNSESSMTDNNESSTSDTYPAGTYSRKGGATIQSIKIDSNGNAEFSEYGTLNGDKSTATYKMELKSKNDTTSTYLFTPVSGSTNAKNIEMTYNSTTKEFNDGAALPYTLTQ